MDSIEEGIDSFLLPEAKNRLKEALHEINERLVFEFRGNVSRNVNFAFTFLRSYHSFKTMTKIRNLNPSCS